MAKRQKIPTMTKQPSALIQVVSLMVLVWSLFIVFTLGALLTKLALAFWLG